MIKTGTSASIEEILKPDCLDAENIKYLSTLRLELENEDLATINSLDPFCNEYRAKVFSIYEQLKDERGYNAEKDEILGPEYETSTARTVSPWNLRDTQHFSEFLLSWGQIFKFLDTNGNQKILEYGPGSGQIILMLARLGFDVYGVDINARYLDIIREQADLYNLDISLEKNVFGKGFDGARFDRIIFFEAFHHSFDFMETLKDLKSKLSIDGYIIFCGEPIAKSVFDGIPYPWGPRMDGLSVYVTRKFGWMELGFTHDFFVEALRRSGFDVEFVPFPDCPRANVYLARHQGSKGLKKEKISPKSNAPFSLTRALAEFMLTVGRSCNAVGEWFWHHQQ